MMNKISKSAFQMILGGFLLVSLATIGCNNSEEKADAPTEETVTPATTPVTSDTTPAVMDTGDVKPVIPGN